MEFIQDSTTIKKNGVVTADNAIADVSIESVKNKDEEYIVMDVVFFNKGDENRENSLGTVRISTAPYESSFISVYGNREIVNKNHIDIALSLYDKEVKKA